MYAMKMLEMNETAFLHFLSTPDSIAQVFDGSGVNEHFTLFTDDIF